MTDLPSPEESPAADDQVDEAFAAYLRSCDAGEIDSREKFLAQFPDIADDLKELMEAADMISSVSMAGQSTKIDRSKAATGADTIDANVPHADDSKRFARGHPKRFAWVRFGFRFSSCRMQ